MTLLADLALSQTFPTASDEQWRKAVETALKGAAFDKLVSKTADDIAIQPLYSPARGDAATARGAAGPWACLQRVDHPDATQANALALEDLEGGASGLTLCVSGATAARGFGLKADAQTFARALDGVMLDLIPIRVEGGGEGRAAARALIDALASSKLDRAKLQIDFGVDPVGALARHGALGSDISALSGDLAAFAYEVTGAGLSGRAFLADGRPWHEAGASEAQELAAVLAGAVETMRLLERGGLTLEAARDQLAFLLAADADQFLTLAKFRALRRLWARVEAASGLSAKPIRLHAETAWRMTTKRDPWVNLLRATVAVFAAGLGGADAITVLPFTSALGLSDAHARRIARNTQLILLEESNLARVVDPAAGAGGVAALTDQLCEAAWRQFQEIEREGGMIASLLAGKAQRRVAAAATERARAIGRRKLPVTGASEFPNVKELPVETLPVAPVAPMAPGTTQAQPLVSRRDAEAFEALRDAADARAVRPSVFLANLGPVAAFTARATFAKNFFEAGGIEALGNDGFASLHALVDAFKASGAKLACLCSSDAVYAEEAAAAAKALTEAGAHVYLAGRPGDLEDALKAAGVIGYAFVGADVLATLKEALNKA